MRKVLFYLFLSTLFAFPACSDDNDSGKTSTPPEELIVYEIITKEVTCVSGDKTLKGDLIYPRTNGNGKVPIALMFHGFGVNRNEMNGLHGVLGQQLAEKGIASLRFDFAGSGESDGEFSEISLVTETRDAEAILAYAKILDFVNTNKIYAGGMSMGGAVATLLGGWHPDEIQALYLWAPAACLVDNTHKDPSITNRGVTFDGESNFYKDVATMDFFVDAAPFKKKVLILCGTNDDIMSMNGGYVHRYREIYGDNMSYYDIEGAGHGYRTEEHREEVLKLTLDFLVEQ